MDMFLASSFGTFVMVMFQGLFTAPSWQSFTLLACGWALASRRHTITAYLWLTGAVTVQPFSRFDVFLGCPFYNARWQVWACIIRHAAVLLPPDAPMVIACDDTTKKKAGRHIEGRARYRNGAGSARQEYRTLRGLNCVLGVMRMPLPAVEAFFTTDLSRSAEDSPKQDRDRWAIEITIRDRNAFDGLGQDQCRQLRRLVGANTFRLALAAARTLWFLDQTSRTSAVTLQRYRPWYRRKCPPSQLDIVWACREALHQAGIFPIPRFIPDLAENHEVPEHTLPSAA